MTGSAGAVYGTAYGIVKHVPPALPAFATAFNSGLAGMTFFALREYVAGPILVHTLPLPAYTRRREAIHAAAMGQATKSFTLEPSELRTHKLLDTALAGSLTGGVLNIWKRGLAGVAPGAFTGGLICTALQFAWNELNVTRIKIILHSRSKSETNATPVDNRTFSEKFLDGLSVIFPMKKISDEEYKQRLLRQREKALKRINEINAELDKENTTERKQ